MYRGTWLLLAIPLLLAAFSVARLDDPVAVSLERVGEELLDGLLVVDEEDGRAVGHARMLVVGNSDGRGLAYTC